MITNNFKNSEIGPIPNEWEVKAIDDCCNVFTGGEAPEKYSSSQDNKYQYPIYSNGRECYGYMETYRISKDAVCISSIGENTGDVFFYKGKFTPIIRLKVIVPKDNSIDTKCLYYLLKWNKIDGTKNGGIPNINADDVKGIKFPLPPLPEQRRIAAALSDIDALIANLDALIDKKRLIKQATMQQLLTGKKRLKGFSEPWVEKKLGELCEFQNGYTPSKAVNQFWKNGTIPWFRMEDIRTNGRILSDSIQHITEEAVKGNLFPSGSILMSTTATIGEHALLIVDSLANQQFTNLKIRKSLTQVVEIMWFYHYCFILGEWCRNNINEGGLAAVNMEDFSNVEIPLPSLEEQKAIASVLSSMDEEISALESKKAKYEQIKQGMMQQLLTGKIRLTD